MEAPQSPAERFKAEYVARRGNPPFPWQLAAAETLGERWPTLAYVSVPTGCGKTCIVDLWHSCSPRRRLVYVINRRIVVESVYDYARKLPDEIKVSQLRGGLPPDERAEWWMWPEERQALVSTVDQAGSALLGQAYGQSRKTAPILQGLVGTDALWVVDEAHLETPFVKTLRDCRQAGADIDIVFMSATPDDLPAEIPVFGLTEADHKHPVLSRRIRKDRLAPRDHPKGKGPQALADEARRLREAGSSVVLVVCNTVKTARQTFERLRKEGDEAELMTGRVRPKDRDAQLQRILPRIGAGTRPARQANPKNMAQLDLFDAQERGAPQERAPLYVVATSAVEVGADIDCDALVGEECEDESQQIQREGRVNRLGELDSAPVSILKPEKPFKLKKPVPPLWLPPDLAVAFDPAPWLHGYGEDLAAVQVVWREDLPMNAIDQEEYFEALPPMVGEAMPVPRWGFGEWLERIGREAVWLDRGTAVVRCDWGGADIWGWNPDSLEPVEDKADEYDTDENGNFARFVRKRLKEEDPVPEGMKVKAYPGGRVAYKPRDWSMGYRAVPLKRHLRSVGEEAAAIAQALGYADPGLFRQAGRAHDIGKADGRFQLWLGAEPGSPLAKSGDAGAARRKLSGLPKGWRHEFASVEKLLRRGEPLLCYLVGTHHGHGRPWFGPPHETPVEWVEMVLALRERHGPWELAAMEAVLRIADWRVSMRGE